MSLFLHLANKKPVRESPTLRPQLASGLMHTSSKEVGGGQLSNFGDIRRRQHKVDTWDLKHDVERLRMKDGARSSQRIDAAGGSCIVGTKSMAEERVQFSDINVEGQTQMEGCLAAILSNDTPDTIQRFSSPMQQFYTSRFIESDSTKDLKRAIANQGSFHGVPSTAFDYFQKHPVTLRGFISGPCHSQSRDSGYDLKRLGNPNRRKELEGPSHPWTSPKGSADRDQQLRFLNDTSGVFS